MTNRTRFFLALGIASLLGIVLLYLVAPAEAQTPAQALPQVCNGVTEITAINSFANIRDLPNITTSVITGRLNKGTYKATDSLSAAGWYKLTEGGYVSESVTVARCVAATPTRTPTPGATVTVTVTPRPTITPVATSDAYLLVLPNGTPYECRRGYTSLPSVTLIDGTWAGCVRAGLDNTPTRQPTATRLPE